MSPADYEHYLVVRLSLLVRVSEDDTDYREEVVYVKDMRETELTEAEFIDALTVGYVNQLPDEYEAEADMSASVVCNRYTVAEYLEECLQNTASLFQK